VQAEDKNIWEGVKYNRKDALTVHTWTNLGSSPWDIDKCMKIIDLPWPLSFFLSSASLIACIIVELKVIVDPVNGVCMSMMRMSRIHLTLASCEIQSPVRPRVD